MKFFNEKKFALASGLTVAAFFFITRFIAWLLLSAGIMPMLPMMGGKMMKLMACGKGMAFCKCANMPMCWGMSFVGLLIKTLIIFVFAAFIGWLFSWIYNMLLDCKGKTTNNTKKIKK